MYRVQYGTVFSTVCCILRSTVCSTANLNSGFQSLKHVLDLYSKFLSINFDILLNCVTMWYQSTAIACQTSASHGMPTQRFSTKYWVVLLAMDKPSILWASTRKSNMAWHALSAKLELPCCKDRKSTAADQIPNSVPLSWLRNSNMCRRMYLTSYHVDSVQGREQSPTLFLSNCPATWEPLPVRTNRQQIANWQTWYQGSVAAATTSCIHVARN